MQDLDSQNSELLNLIKSKAYWKISIRPDTFAEKKIELGDLRTIIEECQVRQRGWYFPVLDRRNGNTFAADDYFTSNVKWNEFLEVWRFYQSGQFVSYMGLAEDWMAFVPYSQGKYLGVILSLYNITEFFIFAKNLAAKKIMGNAIQLDIKLYGTKDRMLIMDEPFRHLHDNYVCHIDEMNVFKGKIPTTKILADYDKIALDATIEVFNKFQWNNPDIKKVLKNDQEKLLKGFF